MTPRQTEASHAIVLFVTECKFHIPRNCPRKEKVTHGSQPPPRRVIVTEPLRSYCLSAK